MCLVNKHFNENVVHTTQHRGEKFIEFPHELAQFIANLLPELKIRKCQKIQLLLLLSAKKKSETMKKHLSKFGQMYKSGTAVLSNSKVFSSILD